MKFLLPFLLLLVASGCSSNEFVFTISPESNFREQLKTAREEIQKYILKGDVEKMPVIEWESGTYFLDSPLQFSTSDSGTQMMPITYRVKSPDKTQFIAGKKLPAFQQREDGIWFCRVDPDWKFEQLFVNGKRAVRARTPNSSFIKITDIKETQMGKKYIQTVSFNPDDLKTISDNSEGLQMIVLHKWDHTRRFLDNVDRVQGKVTTSGRRMKPWNSWKKGTRVYFENFEEALNEPGEWFLRADGILLYMPRPDQKIEDSQAYAPIQEKFLILEGNPSKNEFIEHINFEGFRFAYSAVRTPESGFEPAQAAAPVEATVMADGARHINFYDVHLNHIGIYGMWFRKGCSDIRVEKCSIKDIGAGGIRIGETARNRKGNDRTLRITLHNNIIRDGGHIFPCAVGVWIGQSGHNTVTHNDIGHLYYTAVSIGWTWGYSHSDSKHNIVKYNHLHNIGKGLLSDMGSVYTLGNNPGTIISHNVIHDVNSYSYGGWGLYTDEGSQGIVMENNLVYNTKSGGFHQHYGKNNIIRKNVFANSRLQQIQATRVEKHLSFSFKNNVIYFSSGTSLAGPWDKIKVNLQNNIYWNSAGEAITIKGRNFSDWQKMGKDQGSIVADPLFVNPEENNFTVKDSSPALKLGIDFKAFDKAGLIGKEWRTQAK